MKATTEALVMADALLRSDFKSLVFLMEVQWQNVSLHESYLDRINILKSLLYLILKFIGHFLYADSCVTFPSEDWEIADSTLQFWYLL